MCKEYNRPYRKKYQEEYNKGKKELKAKYIQMLINIEIWNPQEKDLLNLKKFMIKEVTGSIEYDCDILNEIIYEKDYESFYKEKLQDCKRDLEYHQREYTKSKDNLDSVDEWLSKLQDSLDEFKKNKNKETIFICEKCYTKMKQTIIERHGSGNYVITCRCPKCDKEYIKEKEKKYGKINP